MVIRIGFAVLTFAGLFALVSGLLFWTGTALQLMQLHMLLGFLAVGALWVIAIGQLFAKGGSWMIATAALVVGATTAVFGVTQTSIMVGGSHWVIEVLHVFLGVLTIGLGHFAAARYRQKSAV